MVKKIRAYTSKELIIILIGTLLTKILNKLRFNSKYLLLNEAINFFINNNYKVRRTNKYLCVQNKETTLFLRPYTSDWKVFKQVMIEEEYMPLVELIRKKNIAEDIRLIVDVGANIGLTTFFLKKYFKNAEIVAVEPCIANVNCLVKNMKNNNIDGIYVETRALWINDTDLLQLSDDFRDGDYWSKSVKKAIHPKNEAIKAITLKKIIDEYSKENKFIDILKIDIEGTEAVLFNNAEFLKILKDRVLYLCIEIHDEFNCRKSILQELESSMFECFDIGQTTFCYNKNICLNNVLL
jgi:FkbM family methyltransferase